MAFAATAPRPSARPPGSAPPFPFGSARLTRPHTRSALRLPGCEGAPCFHLPVPSPCGSSLRQVSAPDVFLPSFGFSLPIRFRSVSGTSFAFGLAASRSKLPPGQDYRSCHSGQFLYITPRRTCQQGTTARGRNWCGVDTNGRRGVDALHNSTQGTRRPGTLRGTATCAAASSALS